MNVFKPNRHSVRFRGYDYAQHGAYFITVCIDHHRPFFGSIENDEMKPNWVGHIVEREWLRVAELRDNVFLDEYIVMPNHFHAIVLITSPVGTQLAASLRLRDVGGATPNNVAPDSLSAIVRDFKSAVTRHINAHRATQNQSPVVVWQKRFHDRIIRDETELLNTPLSKTHKIGAKPNTRDNKRMQTRRDASLLRLLYAMSNGRTTHMTRICRNNVRAVYDGRTTARPYEYSLSSY